MNSPAPRYPADRIASLSEALADLCLRADNADAALDAVIGQLRPSGRPGLARRLWGRLPGDSRQAPDHAAALRRLIAEADARRIAIAALAAHAAAMGSSPAAAALLAAAEAARAAEQRRAEAGRRALHELLPLSRP